MKPNFSKSAFLLAAGFALGVLATHFTFASAASAAKTVDLSKKHFLISVDEVHQNLVFGDEFSGSYTKTFTLSDGSTRAIELTPMIHNGMQVVEFKDSGGHTYMGLNGTTTNGKLMVQLRDVDTMHELLKADGWAAVGR